MLYQKKKPNRIYLSNGNSFTKFCVVPGNWETPNADVDIKWTLSYRYFDLTRDKPKPRNIAGNVNTTASLSEKQLRMRRLYDREFAALMNGFNPHVQADKNKAEGVRYKRKNKEETYVVPEEVGNIEEHTPFLQAILQAIPAISPSASKEYKEDAYSSIFRILKAVEQLQLAATPVCEIRGKDIRRVFELVRKTHNLQNGRFNRYRQYMVAVVKEFKSQDVTDRDLMSSVQKLPISKLQVSKLTTKEINAALNYLRLTDYNLYRFCHIFYHTAGRPKELCRLKKDDIFLDEKVYKVLIKKRNGTYDEVFKPIHESVHHLWEEVYNQALSGEYLFSENLAPGCTEHVVRQYSNKFSELRKSFKLSGTFYTMKHRKLSELDFFMKSNPGIELAHKITQEAAKHLNYRTTQKHYIELEKNGVMNELLRKVMTTIDLNSKLDSET